MNWYARIDGQEFGPVTIQQLQQWAMESRIVATTEVRQGETSTWIQAEQVQGLMPVAPPPLPVATHVDPTENRSMTVQPRTSSRSRRRHRSSRRERAKRTRNSGERDQMLNLVLGLLGTGALLASVFTPIASAQLLGTSISFSYMKALTLLAKPEFAFNAYQFAALIIIASIGVSFFVTLLKEYFWLLPTSIGAFAAATMTLVKYFSIQQELSSSRESLSKDAFFLPEPTDLINFGFAIPLVILGAGLLMAAALVKGKQLR